MDTDQQQPNGDIPRDCDEEIDDKPRHKRHALFRHPVTPVEKFQAAVRDGDFPYVQSILQEKKENGDSTDLINTRDRNGRTPFNVAIRSGDMCKLALF